MNFRVFKCLIIIAALSISFYAEAQDWRFEKGKHFIIQFPADVSAGWAKTVLREAEYYYEKIARQIGYSRYQNYWTWDQRVKLVIYSNQDIYVKKTGLPSWSKGGAIRYHRQLKSRAIVTFKQEEGFLKNVLPHEISHLVLDDFVGNRTIPLWFNEGVSQLQEADRTENADRLMRLAVSKGRYIPFSDLISTDVRVKISKVYVTFFYAQSVSVVSFLIDQYGSQRFGFLCRELRNGNTFERALQKAYTTILNSVDELEQKWLYSMRN